MQRLKDKLADILLAEKETQRQQCNRIKELEREVKDLSWYVHQHRDLEAQLKALQAEATTLDKMLQEELRLKKQTALVVDIDQLDLFI